MMYKKISLCIVAISFLALFSCGISKDEMRQGIMKKQQETFDTDSFYKEFGLKIQEVSLLKTGFNTYDGIMTVLLEDERYNVPFTVKTDSDSYMWQIEAEDLQFIIRHQLRKMGY